VIEKLIETPGWIIANPATFRRLAARVASFEFIRSGVAVPRCAHRYNPFTDSCPNCEMEEA